jgi:hypothetical protein
MRGSEGGEAHLGEVSLEKKIIARYIYRMSVQIFVLNGTHHNLFLKLRQQKWCLGNDTSFSWRLPIDADGETRYKIKHDGKRIAYVWINHNGLITGVKNYSKSFCVMVNMDRRGLRRYSLPTICVTEL